LIWNPRLSQFNEVTPEQHSFGSKLPAASSHWVSHMWSD